MLTDSGVAEGPCPQGSCIGIGTIPASNTPYKLDVLGHNRFRGPSVTFYLTGQKPGGNEWAFQTVDSDGRLRIFDNTTFGERFSISQSGNVGIGTAAPATKLDVAGTISTSTQYNIGVERVLSVDGLNNTFVGSNTGAIISGSNNSFVGKDAGFFNADGASNTFVGAGAGKNNAAGNANSFFGNDAGRFNTSGGSNSFFGKTAGRLNTANENSFFGAEAGKSNTSGASNTFLGTTAGLNSTTGSNNLFVGAGAGQGNTLGADNTIIGSFADLGTPGLNNATAIGANAVVSQSNSLVLGNSALVGIGTSAPQQALHVNGASEIFSTGSGAGFKFRDRSGSSIADDWVWYADGNFARFFHVNSGDLLFVTDTGNLGVGAVPGAKLHVSGGDVAVTNQSSGLILRATNGPQCFRITVDNSGALNTAPVACP